MARWSRRRPAATSSFPSTCWSRAATSWPDVDPGPLGHKTLAVNLSDLAAMGARPRWALLAGALPDDDERWLEGFARGLLRAGGPLRRRADRRRHDARTAQPVPDDHRRTAGGHGASRARGAAVGDDIHVSGTLGDAALALAVLQGARSPPSRRSHARARGSKRPSRGWPGPAAARRGDRGARRLGRTDRRPPAHSRRFAVSAPRIDLARIPRSPVACDRCSTGRQRDLGLALPSRRRRRLRALLHGAPPRRRAIIAAIARDVGVAVTRIGSVTAGHGLVVRDERGAPLSVAAAFVRSLRLSRWPRVRPLAFLFRHPAHFIALGFGAGLSPRRARHVRARCVAIPLALLLPRMRTTLDSSPPSCCWSRPAHGLRR